MDQRDFGDRTQNKLVSNVEIVLIPTQELSKSYQNTALKESMTTTELTSPLTKANLRLRWNVGYALACCCAGSSALKQVVVSLVVISRRTRLDAKTKEILEGSLFQDEAHRCLPVEFHVEPSSASECCSFLLLRSVG
jgi:CRISPR/Cas system CMR subunit Cmr4 (Cas7 group RAMP superfamily)